MTKWTKEDKEWLGYKRKMSVQNKDAVDITGGTMTGTTVNSVTVGTNASGNKTFSTSNPSGGENGDIWYKYI